jgi:molecular chaperone DnaK
MKESADKITDADKAPIQAAIEKVKQASKGNDVAAIRQAVNEMEQASHAMAQHLYGKGQPSGGPGAGGPGAGGPGPDGGPKPAGDGKKDDVIDAEYEVKK